MSQTKFSDVGAFQAMDNASEGSRCTESTLSKSGDSHYLLKCPSFHDGSANSSCTTLCDSGDETQHTPQCVNSEHPIEPQTFGSPLCYPEPFVYSPQCDIEISPLLGESYNKKRENVISGVKFQPSDNRWIARWTTADGKRACKSFSVNIYGFEQARALAIEARHKGVTLSGRSFCNRERQHAMRSGVGIIGIRFDKTQARWVSSYYEGGKRKFRYFTVKDYGYEQAKQHAILWKTCNDERLIRNRIEKQNRLLDIKKLDNPMDQAVDQDSWCRQTFLNYDQSNYNYFVGNCYYPSVECYNNATDCMEVPINDFDHQSSQMVHNGQQLQLQDYSEKNFGLQINRACQQQPTNGRSANVVGFIDPTEQMCYGYPNTAQINRPEDLPTYRHYQQGYGYEALPRMAQEVSYQNCQNDEVIDQFQLAERDEQEEEESCSVSGVTFDRKNRRWGARWTAHDGRRAGRYFPVRQYGFHEAKRLAVICRLKAIEEAQANNGDVSCDFNNGNQEGGPAF